MPQQPIVSEPRRRLFWRKAVRLAIPILPVTACALTLFTASLSAFADRALVSGEPILVGTHGGLGPLAAPKLNNVPVGAVHVFGKSSPDLFVMDASRFYPNFALFPWREITSSGVPVFDPPLTVTAPEYVNYANPGTIFEQDNRVHALWTTEGSLVHLVFDLGGRAFREVERVPMPRLPRGAQAIGWLPDPDGPGFQLLVSVSDGIKGSPPLDNAKDSRDARYMPYDGAGNWRGGFPYSTLYIAHVPGLLQGPIEDAHQAALTPREVRVSYMSLTAIDLGPGRERDVIGGSRFGPLYYYHQSSTTASGFDARQILAGPDGESLRHPTVGARPVSYPNAKGQRSDLIAGGEGALYYYRFLDRFTMSGQPVYAPPTPALQRSADLFAGTLPVVNVVDWNGDGRLDIVAGNSEGLVLVFENKGTNRTPAFAPGRPLEAGGRTIYIQAGYAGSVQGPDEARWGYVSPTVVDWNEDGLPDLVMSDVTAQHRVFLNEGTRRKPKLGFEHPIYLDGLELHGAWRVRPDAAKLGKRMAYVCLDDNDEFHLYWKLDTYNLEDGGKLKLADGAVIGANYLKAGGTGRLKFKWVDWDADGNTDLLVGTPRHASVPDPTHGLPQSLGKPGAAVLLLRNVGSDEAPVFATPQTLAFRGKPIYFEQHECSADVAPFGDAPRPGLVVGIETGRILYYAREDIEFVTPAAAAR